ncbi:MAG: 4Fe-4S dicluster domain-containing protein, partial [Cyanobacteria bacterium REEB65]|nr:4Fe-4S dicluster domain-containing protein [Cyanobacteria bacterium REEB65]
LMPSALDGAGMTYLAGGPLSGRVVEADSPLQSGISLVVALPTTHPAVAPHLIPMNAHLRRALATCENCEQCTALCPQHLAGQALEPHKIVRAIAHGLDHLTDAVVGAAHCSGCGLCTAYACPVGLAPSVITMAVRSQLDRQGYQPTVKEAHAKPFAADRRVPLERLLRRLDLARFDQPAPLAGTLTAGRVWLPLEAPSGRLASPVVRDGHLVKAGQRIAEVPLDAPAVPVFASISGRIRLIPGAIEITATQDQERERVRPGVGQGAEP